MNTVQMLASLLPAGNTMAPALVNVADFGVYPDTGKDQTAEMIAALSNMGKTVKAIEHGYEFHLARGTYIFDWSAVLKALPQQEAVVMRGAGDGTTLIFQESPCAIAGQDSKSAFTKWNDVKLENCTRIRNP